MNPLQDTKMLNMVPPAAIKDNAAFTSVIVDTAGYGWLTVVVTLGATDIAMAALSIQENSANTATGMASITGTVFGTATDAYSGSTTVLPGATDDNKIEVFHIKLDGTRKRYMQVAATAGDGSTGTFMSAVGILSHAAVAPNTASEAGADFVVIV